jgi:predicted component of type VI protein secretion system
MNEGERHMEFTEKELREQELALAALKEELSRLNAQFDGLLKDAGLSLDDLSAAREENLTPEMARMLEQAKEEAARAGQARAAQFQAETAPSGSARGAGRGRPGAVRI